MGLLNTLFKPALLILLLSFFTSASANQKILVWGDSLSAAYGIPVDKGWVNLMREKLGDEFEITNGSISGETTRGGLTRLPKALKKVSPDFVILELGANDGLRGLPPNITKRFRAMSERSPIPDLRMLATIPFLSSYRTTLPEKDIQRRPAPKRGQREWPRPGRAWVPLPPPTGTRWRPPFSPEK